jgi:glycosyltransferase involved in cell wall biosynthesis
VSESDLEAELEFPLPTSLPVGRATAVFLYGTCHHRRREVERLEVVVGGRRHRPTAQRMPRRDRAVYRCGFWATVPVEASPRPGTIELGLSARLAGGGEAAVPIGAIEVVAGGTATGGSGAAGAGGADGSGPIAICMATFEPDLELFRAQIASLREQTEPDWVCLVSDDCSAPQRFAAIEDLLGGDPRFVLSRSERRLGFYRNFERALEMVPPEAELVALCDQDDRWYPHKLEVLREALGGAQLVYSDQRLVDAGGRVLAESLWAQGRRNNHTSLASALVANSVTGAAALFRREVAELALPFPETPGWQFHDHWLGLVALALGDLAYVDRPLYDYVQHRGAILGQVAVDPEAAAPRQRAGLGQRLAAAGRDLVAGGRAAYFCGYLRIAVQAQTLLVRCGERAAPGKRRALRRFLAAGRSPLALAWLAARPLRRLAGRNETLGAERQLVRGVLWRHAVALRARRVRSQSPTSPDAAFPPCGPDSFGQKRMRRWRAASRAAGPARG